MAWYSWVDWTFMVENIRQNNEIAREVNPDNKKERLPHYVRADIETAEDNPSVVYAINGVRYDGKDSIDPDDEAGRVGVDLSKAYDGLGYEAYLVNALACRTALKEIYDKTQSDKNRSGGGGGGDQDEACLSDAM